MVTAVFASDQGAVIDLTELGASFVLHRMYKGSIFMEVLDAQLQHVNSNSLFVGSGGYRASNYSHGLVSILPIDGQAENMLLVDANAKLIGSVKLGSSSVNVVLRTHHNSTAVIGSNPTIRNYMDSGNLLLSSATIPNLVPMNAWSDGNRLAIIGRSTTSPFSTTLVLSDFWGNTTCQASGLCAKTFPEGCDDNKVCTKDSCDPNSGCLNSAVSYPAPCTDNNPCTHTDACTSGKCLGTPTPAPNCAMTPLPPATIDLGCKDDTDCQPDESPVHALIVPAFALDTKEVSNLQYAACISAGKCTAPASSSSNCTHGKAGKDSHPVNCITYDQAAAYCKWAYADGRLPTEAEWERAARGTDGRKYPWGSATPDATLANFLTSATKAVGLVIAGKSQDGLLDLAGNVREWVADWYSPSAYSASPVPPTGPTTGTERVLRGGGYSSPANTLRGSARDHADPTLQAPTIGFRCARSGN